MAMVEPAVAMAEDGCKEDGEAKTSSRETSGTAGSGPSSKTRLLHGQALHTSIERSLGTWGASKALAASWRGANGAGSS